MDEDWDLHAVVRGCRVNSLTDSKQAAAAAAALDDDDTSDRLGCFIYNSNLLDHQLSFPPPQPQEDLCDLYPPFFLPLSSAVVASVSPPPPPPPQQTTMPKTPDQGQPPHNNTSTATPRSKRRKNQFKKVRHVPAEGLSSDDTWSWRKYGQKPIKGSPFPRGYYRCSSSKGCPARKQVERNRSDPNMFIVTYTAEHNHPPPTHRNSLAGTTRHHHKLDTYPIQQHPKPTTSTSSAFTTTSSSDDDVDDRTDVRQSTKTENQFEDLVMGLGLHQQNNMDGCGLFFEMTPTDDFFDGLDEITASPHSRLDVFPLSWLANSTGQQAGKKQKVVELEQQVVW